VVMLATGAVMASGIFRLSFDSSLKTLTPRDDPALILHKVVQETFGDQEIGVVAILVDDAYTPEVLQSLRRLTDRIGALAGIDRAMSLTTVKDPVRDVLNPPPLIPKGPITAETARTVRERVSVNPIYSPHLVATDGRAVAINVFFAKGRSDEDEPAIDAAILEAIGSYDGPGEVYYAGMSHIRVRSTEMMREDLARFLPLSLLCMMGVLWLAFRSFRATLLPLFSIAFGVSILLGLMGWFNAPITLTTLVLPSLLLVIGGSYSVHVTVAVLESGESDDCGLQAVLHRVGLPIMISALTTAVGFGALALHPIPAISRLGKFAVLGIAVLAVGALYGLSLLFFALPRREAARDARRAGRIENESDRLDWLDRALERAADFSVVRRRWIFAVAAAVVVFGVMGAARLEVDTDLLSSFRRGSDVRLAHQAITERLAGPNPVSIVISGPEPGHFKSIVALRRVEDFQAFIDDLDEIDSSISLLDYLDLLDRGLQSSAEGLVVNDKGELVEAPPPKSFWDDPAQLATVLDLVALSPGTFAGVVDPEFRRLRITARTAVSGSRDTARLVDSIQTYAEVIFPRGVFVDVTGNLVVVSTVADKVLSGQVQSVALAFLVIFAVLSIQFLSLRVGLAAMIPNVLPLLLFFGVMGWAGIELNLGTSIIAAVALGIAVDDTIHYMTTLNRVVKTSRSQRAALRTTMRLVGRPVVATSITLTAGFLVMLISRFGLITTFGWLSAMTMMVALTTNIFVLPAVLATVPVISVWDLVAFQLGPSPNKTIRLFQGLGALSVRLVVLLGRVRSFAADEPIMRRGDHGEEMYLVLQGTAEVRAEDGRVLAGLGRGDVVGEMGLLRRTVRSADVVASDAVEVLVIDEDFLRRLRVLYPRFASRFFLNIARILSDRLEQANERAQQAREPPAAIPRG
jgi:predicted RND superfamily exporter protein